MARGARGAGGTGADRGGGRLKTRTSLQTRVGIATGLVVVGDLIGSGEAQERGIVGETPNFAARLQGIAEPNSGRHRRGHAKATWQSISAGRPRGKGPQGYCWAGAGLCGAAGEFGGRPFRGAARERPDRAGRAGRRTRIAVAALVSSKERRRSGSAPLRRGRHRQIAAHGRAMERLAGEPHTRLRYFCSPQHTDSAFYPIISQMERAAGLAHDDSPQAKLDKLDALLAQSATSAQDAALFADMLSLPNDGRYPALDLAPELRRQRTLEALTSQLAGLARQKPVLMIVEDAHWIDPTSLEVFGRTVDRIKALPTLLIVTFRPEFNAPWMGQSHVTSLTLNRLGEREAAAIIARLLGNKELPADVMTEIVERTDGIPLFVEEMTKAVLEAESEGEARRTAAAVPSPALAVPASLHASLMARLDRLGPAKEVAQIGAAIGREFSHALLAVVVPKPEAELRLALDRLIEAGLLFRQGLPPHATYLFKHALVQDAAYGTLLREPRRALHARIAETLETQFAEIAESQPELLARHYTEAGLIEKAVSFWRTAGQRSLARSALLEGAEQLKRALDQIATLPATPDLHDEEIKLYSLSRTLWRSPATLWMAKSTTTGRSRLRSRRTPSGLRRGLAGMSGSPSCRLVPGVCGHLAIPRLRAMTATRSQECARNRPGYHFDVCADPAGFNYTLWGNFAAANAQLDELIALADERGAPFWKALGTALRGCLFALTGKASDAVRAITSGITSLRSTGATLYEPRHLWFLAMAYAEAGAA